jgi:hypothetical protein
MSDNDPNHMLGYPDSTPPEPEPAQQLEQLHEKSPDQPLPPVEAYETVTEQIPAGPLDLATVAQHVSQQVAWDDPVAYATAYTDRIVQANQALGEQVLNDLWSTQE